MLAEDAKGRKQSVIAASLKQGTLDNHLKEPTGSEKVLPYTDWRFCEAAIEQLISTNQVCFYLLYSNGLNIYAEY